MGLSIVRLTIADIREALKTSFRPLSGKWGYRFVDDNGIEHEHHGMVSVPSRGNGVIDWLRLLQENIPLWRFPSPLGEMGLSIRQDGPNYHR